MTSISEIRSLARHTTNLPLGSTAPAPNTSDGFTAPLAVLESAGVIVFKGAPTDPTYLLEIARAFGTLEVTRPPRYRLCEYEHIRHQSNVDGVGIRGGGNYWHADSPWYDPPAVATLLLCTEAPPCGGRTLFVDMRAVLEELPSELRDIVDRAIGLYPCREIVVAEHRADGVDDPVLVDQMHDIQRPLVRTHPIGCGHALYLNQKWLTSIEGYDALQSDRILQSLYDAVEQSPARYVHAWEPGDLLVWDNSVVCHKAEPIPDDCPKTTWRIVIKSFARPTRSTD